VGLGRLAQRHKIAVRDRVGHDQPVAVTHGKVERGFSTARTQGLELKMADLELCLTGKPSPYVGVGHRRQRMFLHAGFAEQPVADEEVAVVERATVGRKGGANQRQRRIQFLQKRLRHRPDIALRR
jgi:hypothetical protein